VLACGSGPTGPSVSLKQLEGAPETVAIGDREFTLETSLYRDFFPICPPDGRPLIAITYVVASGEEQFPVWLDADRLWVVNGEEVWEVVPIEEKRPYPDNQLMKVARDGPKWKPRIYVDVVVRLVDAKGNTYLLRAADQQIGLSR
jgi:hypothetical protein